MKPAKKILAGPALVFVVLGLIFFLSLPYYQSYIGGDAASGYKTKTTYFVKNLETNEFKEVSAAAWYSNYVFSIMTFVFFGLGMTGYFCLLLIGMIALVKQRHGRK